MIRPVDRQYCRDLAATLSYKLQWTVYEANEPDLWNQVSTAVSNHLNGEWRQGSIDGMTEDRAYYVRCGRDTMTLDDITRGRLIVDAGAAFGDPPEFITFQVVLQVRPGEP